MPYFFRALNFSSGFWSVTRALPRTDCRALSSVGFVDGVELEDVLGLRVDLRQGQQQMLGRDELVLHLASARRWAASSTCCSWLRDVRAGMPPDDLGQMPQFGVDDPIRAAARLTPILSSIGPTTPSLSASRPASRCSGIDLRIAAIGGQLLCPLDGLLGFDRQFVEAKCHMKSSALSSKE